MRLLGHEAAVTRRLATLAADRFAERLFRTDPSLWSNEPAVRKTIRNRLGWLRAPQRMLGEVEALNAFATQVRESGTRHVVLLGMGGSSLCPEVLRRVFERPRGHPDLTILDSTVPAAVQRVTARLDLTRTLFLVSSKSGTTTETLALQSHFWGRLRRLRGRDAGRHFAAITDPGTPLSALAASRRYLATFHNPEDIGGRYSALSYFGLVPAALLGIDLRAMLERSIEMLRLCGPGRAPSENPGLLLGAALGELARGGRDKVVLLVDPDLEPFGLWIEQLIAESTGKSGRGVVPVEGTAWMKTGPAAVRGPDRVAVGVTVSGGAGGRAIDRLVAARPPAALGDTPIISLKLRDRLDLGASMIQWEVATAVTAAILEVNPFDEPNVRESKENTEAALGARAPGGRLDEGDPFAREGSASVFLSSAVRVPRSAGPASSRDRVQTKRTLTTALAALMARPGRGDYLALLAFVDPWDEANRSSLVKLRAILSAHTGLAATVGYGPRYLHSTGQLHKGGPGTGIFIQVTPDDPAAVDVPGEPYDLETLKQAQALGDYRALERRGRRILRLRYTGEAPAALKTLLRSLERAAGRRRRR
jgi:glucose-6-phosphate isomerase